MANDTGLPRSPRTCSLVRFAGDLARRVPPRPGSAPPEHSNFASALPDGRERAWNSWSRPRAVPGPGAWADPVRGRGRRDRGRNRRSHPLPVRSAGPGQPPARSGDQRRVERLRPDTGRHRVRLRLTGALADRRGRPPGDPVLHRHSARTKSVVRRPTETALTWSGGAFETPTSASPTAIRRTSQVTSAARRTARRCLDPMSRVVRWQGLGPERRERPGTG